MSQSEIVLKDADIAFLQELIRASEQNSKDQNKVALTVSTKYLSPQLVKLFGIEEGASGAWFFNVYVEFVPYVTQHPAKDWQQSKM